MFPTTYSGRKYDSCAVSTSNSYVWCSLKTNAGSYTGHYGYCGDNCANSKIVFRQIVLLILSTVATIISKNNLLTTVPDWGPHWRLSFEVNIVSFTDFDADGTSVWADILQFSATGSTCCAVGDRVPYVQANSDGYFIIGSGVGGNGNWYSPNIVRPKLLWYFIEISQVMENGKVTENIYYHHKAQFSV